MNKIEVLPKMITIKKFMKNLRTKSIEKHFEEIKKTEIDKKNRHLACETNFIFKHNTFQVAKLIRTVFEEVVIFFRGNFR